MPDNHIVVLYQNKLVAHLEEIWTYLNTTNMPRTVNIITGPSPRRIEQTIQLGTHGPRRLFVINVLI